MQRLALPDTQARPETPKTRERRLSLIALAQHGKYMAAIERLLPLLVHESRLADAELLNVIRDMARNVGKDSFLRQQQAVMHRPDSRDSMESIRCPTLVVCGANDLVTPRDRREEMVALIPDSTLVVIASCGHTPTLERPLEVNRAFEAWLA